MALGVPVEREFKPGEIHFYGVSARAGEYFRIVVMQQGIDLVVRLIGPDGVQITEVDSPTARNGPEPASAVAVSTGTYHLEVRAADPHAVAGRYQILLVELRQPNARDRQQIAAERMLVEAEDLQAPKTEDSLHRALRKYAEALPILRATGDRWKEAETLTVMGSIYFLLGELSQSLNFAMQAQPLWQGMSKRFPIEVANLKNIGTIYLGLGDAEKAIECYTKALSLNRQMNDRFEEASMLLNLGNAYIYVDVKTATQYMERSLSLSREIQHQTLEANILGSLGDLYSTYGEPRKALQYYTAALELDRELADRGEEGLSLRGLGHVYLTLGETQKAIQSFKDALSLFEVAGSRGGEATTLVSIGLTHLDAGQPQFAISYFQKALFLSERLGNQRNQAFALYTAALAYRDLGEFQQAWENLNKAQVLYHRSRNALSEARTLSQIGSVELLLGRRDEAIAKLQRALQLQIELNDRLGQALALSEIGSIYSSQGKLDQAIGCFQEALSLQRVLGYKRHEAETLYRLGAVEVKQGQLNYAKSNLELALKIVEELRANYFNQDLRTSFSASVRNYYELYIDVLMALHRASPNSGFDVLAFETTERARARSLLEILRESHADIRQGVDAMLLDRERATQQQLNAKAEWLNRIRGGSYSKEQETEASRQIEALVNELQDIQSEIRAKSPRYAALMQPQPFTVRELQQQLLDENTVLVEYSLGEERSYCFVLDSKKLTTYVLPRRAVIDEAARRAYAVLINKADEVDPEALLRLSRLVLYPIANQLNGKRILVVSDGALQFVPFAVLPEPTPHTADLSVEAQTHLALILSHEVVSLPSASVMMTQREQAVSREVAAKKVVVLADPVFERDDARVHQSLQHSGNHSVSRGKQPLLTPAAPPLQGSAADLGVARFARLPTSRIEAEYVTAKLARGEYLKALDFSATWSLATSGELSKYQIIHFATHSLLNNQHPELSGIVLSLVDRDGRAQDGFLRLNEIYNLKLNADLVVLSACQTAVGRDVKGEGLIGLTRGFMYAGAPRVIASLWKVSDEATAELMKRLYENMLARGMRPAAALRAAQISLLKEKQWRAPYYWAGFQIQGEWR